MQSMKVPHRRFHYVLFHKPFGVLSQFTRYPEKKSLADFGPFPRDVYPVGRLDFDSEGLLLLTNDNNVNHRLTDPKFGHRRSYLVQVEGTPSEVALTKLRQGMIVAGKKTRSAEVHLLKKEPSVPERSVPIRFRKNVPTSWLEISLTEGRNRQVRRMTAAAGHPTLRLIRIRIGSLGVGNLSPGEHRLLTRSEIATLLDKEPPKKKPRRSLDTPGSGRLS